MATHSSILAWRIPWTEEPGGLQSMGLQSRMRLSTQIAQILINDSLFWKEQSRFWGQLGHHHLRMMLLNTGRVPAAQGGRPTRAPRARDAGADGPLRPQPLVSTTRLQPQPRWVPLCLPGPRRGLRTCWPLPGLNSPPLQASQASLQLCFPNSFYLNCAPPPIAYHVTHFISEILPLICSFRRPRAPGTSLAVRGLSLQGSTARVRV